MNCSFLKPPDHVTSQWTECICSELSPTPAQTEASAADVEFLLHHVLCQRFKLYTLVTGRWLLNVQRAQIREGGKKKVKISVSGVSGLQEFSGSSVCCQILGGSDAATALIIWTVRLILVPPYCMSWKKKCSFGRSLVFSWWCLFFLIFLPIFQQQCCGQTRYGQTFSFSEHWEVISLYIWTS